MIAASQPVIVPTPDGVAWYAVTTRCKHEKVAAEHLRARGIETFLPLYEARRQWHDRRKVLQLPLFPGYLFVWMTPLQRSAVVAASGVVDLVGARPYGTAIPEDEMQAVRSLLDTKRKVELCPYLSAGDRVRVRYGPLAGTEGILVRIKDRFRIVVSIHLIQRSVLCEIDAADVLPRA